MPSDHVIVQGFALRNANSWNVKIHLSLKGNYNGNINFSLCSKCCTFTLSDCIENKNWLFPELDLYS